MHPKGSGRPIQAVSGPDGTTTGIVAVATATAETAASLFMSVETVQVVITTRLKRPISAAGLLGRVVAGNEAVAERRLARSPNAGKVRKRAAEVDGPNASERTRSNPKTTLEGYGTGHGEGSARRRAQRTSPLAIAVSSIGTAT